MPAPYPEMHPGRSVEPLFTSIVGGGRLRERVLEVLAGAAEASRHQRVQVHVMTFSFTDPAIAARLAETARAYPDLRVRIIADWSQGSEGSGRQVRALGALGLENLAVRYKNDQPYIWDRTRGRVRWSYRASRGLLHHKTLGVIVDGRPTELVCGSFNWTAASSAGYENLLVVSGADPGGEAVLGAVEGEFEALWCDGLATLSPGEALAHHRAIIEEFRQDPGRDPAEVVGLGGGAGAEVESWRDREPPVGPAGDATIAFSSRSPHQSRAEAGFALANRQRRLELHKPGGAIKWVPLTLSTLALDVIARARPGERLLVAMYGMSPRVPEYGALLDAARRGVRLLVLLDGRVGRSMLARLSIATHREQLPIRLRGGARTMHQKYVVHPESATVLTGTANLSTDASERHCEHRIALRGRPDVAAAFEADFRTIWSRLPPPFAAGQSVDTPRGQP